MAFQQELISMVSHQLRTKHNVGFCVVVVVVVALAFLL
jgi:hypothetical protein